MSLRCSRSSRSSRSARRPAVGAALAIVVVLVAAGCEDERHGLSRDQIEQTMKDRGAALKSCWRATGPHGELKLRVAVRTSPDGHVESAVAEGKDGAVRACLEKQIKGWTFPKAEASTKFSLPVNFTR